MSGGTLKILGSSDPDNQGIVGQKSTDTRIQRIITTEQTDKEEIIIKRLEKEFGY